MTQDLNTLQNEAVTAGYRARDLAIIAHNATRAAAKAHSEASELKSLYEEQSETEGKAYDEIELPYCCDACNRPLLL
jgi:hypothetical protein